MINFLNRGKTKSVEDSLLKLLRRPVTFLDALIAFVSFELIRLAFPVVFAALLVCVVVWAVRHYTPMLQDL